MTLATDFRDRQMKAIMEFIVNHDMEIMTTEEMDELIDAIQNPDDYLGVN